MGEVWEAERADGQFEQIVALKLVKRGMDSEEVLRRFLRERQILARLEHPNIARLLDGGLAPDGRPYLVLERVDGEPIVAWCRAQRCDLAARVRLVIAVAEAVDLAHRNLVVHRDLKPSNLLVDATGTVKLLDFGIAKILASDPEGGASTRLEDRALTPAYAAPEQILGRPATTSTDVYSLGVVLYELLTGRLPHVRATTSHLGLAQEVERETLTRPSRVVAEAGDPRGARALAGDLDTIVVKALAREPERRYGSISAFADDLRRYLDGRPVRARPDSGLYRARKFVARHRLAVAAAALVVAALVAGLSIALWQARRAEQAARLAQAQASRAEQVRAFLVSIFEAADPARARGETVEARTLLDEGARRIDAELAKEPELHAELLELLAGLYRKLGELERAKSLAERAFAEHRRLFGDESVQTARSEWTLGWVLANQGDFTPARERLEHAIAVLDREEGPESLAAADAREPLMEVLFGVEGARGALPVIERRLATYRAVLGERDVRTALSLSDFGVVANELRRVEEAEGAFRSSAAHRRRAPAGERSPRRDSAQQSRGASARDRPAARGRARGAQGAGNQAQGARGPPSRNGAHIGPAEPDPRRERAARRGRSGGARGPGDLRRPRPVYRGAAAFVAGNDAPQPRQRRCRPRSVRARGRGASSAAARGSRPLPFGADQSRPRPRSGRPHGRGGCRGAPSPAAAARQGGRSLGRTVRGGARPRRAPRRLRLNPGRRRRSPPGREYRRLS